MSVIIDAVLLLIIVLTVISSMRKGFLSSVLSIICVIFAIIGASVLCEPAAEWCYDNVVDSIVVNTIADEINSVIIDGSGVNAVKSAVDSIPDIVIDQLSAAGVNVNSLIGELSLLDLSAEDAAIQISQKIVRPGALVILRVITYLILYLVIRFVLNIVAGVIHRIFNFSLFKKANRLLGAALGLVKGTAIVFMIATLLNLYADIVNNNDAVNQAIEFSYICGIINDVDFLELLAK